MYLVLSIYQWNFRLTLLTLQILYISKTLIQQIDYQGIMKYF